MTWTEHAACKDLPKEAFFPKRGGDSAQTVEAARTVCRHCPVLAECREAGRTEKHGIWAGQTVDERGKRTSTTRVVRVHGTINGYRQHDRYEERPCRDCLDAFHSYEARRVS